MRSHSKNSFYEITYKRITAVVIFVVILFCIKIIAQKGLARISFLVGMPIMKTERIVGAGIRSVSTTFTSKEALDIKNQQLQTQVESLEAQLLDYNLVKSQQNQLMHLQPTKGLVVSVIKKPPYTPYDYVMVSFPSTEIIAINDSVYAYSDTDDLIHSIGTVTDVFFGGALVKLFSTPDTDMLVSIGEKKIQVHAIGAGTGLLTIQVSKSIPIKEGDVVTTIEGKLIGKIIKVEQNTEQAFTSGTISIGVNTQELSIVSIAHANSR